MRSLLHLPIFVFLPTCFDLSCKLTFFGQFLGDFQKQHGCWPKRSPKWRTFHNCLYISDLCDFASTIRFFTCQN